MENKLTPADRKNVHLTNSLFRTRAEINRKYIKELNTTALLQNFYLEAGLSLPGLRTIEEPEKAYIHWGWESPVCQLRGHFLGHWLSSAAKIYASENDTDLKARIDFIISEIARCQKLNGGEWTGPVPEKYFERLATKEYIWSPQYTMHKTVMGLTDAYLYAENKQALAILDKLADWYVRWTGRMLKECPEAIYNGEQGGMLEMWAILYGITKKKKYMTLAERYMNDSVFAALEKGEDALTNIHTNASIPLSHGSAKMYEVTGDKKWLDITKLFWKCAVTDRGMYCTTGQNSGEFWIPPHMFGKFISNEDQEFCTVYNMVRTASYLYRFTGDAEYSDYIERALYNGFLAQQNKMTGMPTYFLPLEAGSRKKWGSRTRDFWCCHGTMVQSQTLYNELIYYTDSKDNAIYISQYIPSQAALTLGEHNISVSQTVNMKYSGGGILFDNTKDSETSMWSLKLSIRCEEGAKFTLKLRLPEWSGKPKLAINGKDVKISVTNGYISAEREWQDDTLELFFPSEIRTEFLPDMPDTAAFVKGPVVLAGLTDTDSGVEVKGRPSDSFFQRTTHTYSGLPWKQDTFITRGAGNIKFIPLYEVTDEPYTVYFTINKE